MLPCDRGAQAVTSFIFVTAYSYMIVTQSFGEYAYISMSMCIFKIEIWHNFEEQSLDPHHLDSNFISVN